MSGWSHRWSRELSRTESDQGRDIASTGTSSPALTERGRDGLPHHLRATSSTPVLTRARSRSRDSVRDSIYSGKQLRRHHSPDPRLKPLRPAIRYPPGFEFVENSFTPSASASVQDLASSSSHPTANSSVDNVDLPTSSKSSLPESPKPKHPKAQGVDGETQPKRHPASVIAKVARPSSPNTVDATPVSPIHEEEPNDSFGSSFATTPKQVAFESGSAQAEPSEAEAVSPAALPSTLPPLRESTDHPRLSLDTATTSADVESNLSADMSSTKLDSVSELVPKEEEEEEGSRKRGSFLRRFRDRRTSSNSQATKDDPGVLQRATALFHPNKASTEEALDDEEDELPENHWTKSVGFDTMPDALETSSEIFSFMLQTKTQGYQRSKNTRVFMCAVDSNTYSETALVWCMEQLVEDGDEVIACRVVEGEKEELDQDSIREQARDLLDQIADLNDEVPGRKISIVVEFIHGHPTATLLRLILGYRPNSLTVGTRGRSANTFQKLLGGAPMIGHVSRDILQRSPVPVVVVRPEAKVRKHLNKRLNNPHKRAYRNLLCDDPKSPELPLSDRGQSGSLVRDSSQPRC